MRAHPDAGCPHSDCPSRDPDYLNVNPDCRNSDCSYPDRHSLVPSGLKVGKDNVGSLIGTYMCGRYCHAESLFQLDLSDDSVDNSAINTGNLSLLAHPDRRSGENRELSPSASTNSNNAGDSSSDSNGGDLTDVPSDPNNPYLLPSHSAADRDDNSKKKSLPAKDIKTRSEN
jgi:hypothetical protein